MPLFMLVYEQPSRVRVLTPELLLCNSFLLSAKMRFLARNLLLRPHLLCNSISSSAVATTRSEGPASTARPTRITSDDLAQINILIPRLCESNNFREAIRVFVTSLLLNPPLDSLPLPFLIQRLSSDPQTAPPFALLTALHRTGPYCHYALPRATRLLVAAYLKDRRHREATKVFDWTLRRGLRGVPDAETYRVLIRGMAMGGKMMETVRVLRWMVNAGLSVEAELRDVVVDSLLREARVREASEMGEALRRLADGDDEVQSVVKFIDQMLRDSDWRE
ncbi:hypothetical protein H6P81_019755 [Aristolochia fimbriata]|uniref:Pentatricopeptide repeat-containing protein n=1 Tax=Aristolochia fimbriata TaxID=158543 RepID=A0AAV7DSP1_ARIFI|nr:hypothetical protein H6P81_019755 [Aristolochia fimbriata]